MTDEEKKAIKDCDTIFMCLEDMMSEESADDYRSSYRLIKNLINNQQKEIEEKTTIIMAGAEKVKQLEKGNRSLMESRIKWKNRYYKEKAKNKECISKDKIREKIKELVKNEYWNYDKIRVLQELLEEK